MFGDKVLERIEIEPRVMLVRVINHGGKYYSAIEIDGEEYLSTPTDSESGMIEFFKKNRWIYLA